jgi:hypothetical protein
MNSTNELLNSALQNISMESITVIQKLSKDPDGLENYWYHMALITIFTLGVGVITGMCVFLLAYTNDHPQSFDSRPKPRWYLPFMIGKIIPLTMMWALSRLFYAQIFFYPSIIAYCLCHYYYFMYNYDFPTSLTLIVEQRVRFYIPVAVVYLIGILFTPHYIWWSIALYIAYLTAKRDPNGVATALLQTPHFGGREYFEYCEHHSNLLLWYCSEFTAWGYGFVLIFRGLRDHFLRR